MEPLYEKLLGLPDPEFSSLIPQLIGQFADLLQDEQFDALEEDPARVVQQLANRQALFLLLLRSISLMRDSPSITSIIPIVVLCDALQYFLPANTRLLQQYISPLQDAYRKDLKDLTGKIIDVVRQMEKGGGKKSSSSASIDLNCVAALVNTMSNLSLIWPSAFTEEFWAISYSSSCILFVYDALSRMVSNDGKTVDSHGEKVQACKRDVLAMFNRMLKEKFWEPLSGTADDEEKEFILNNLCDWSLYILDNSSSNMGHGKVECLADAPLLLDFEIFYGMSESLQQILTNFKGEGKDFDSSRLEYLLMSLESLVSFSGNSQRHIDERQKRIKSSPPSYNQASADAGPTALTANTISPEDHVDLMLKISHVHDLFPDLGDGFIEACLREFDNDPEVVVMALLENQLPPQLQVLDRLTPSTRLALSLPVEDNNMALVRVGSQESIATAVSRSSTLDADRNINTAVTSIDNLKLDDHPPLPQQAQLTQSSPQETNILSTRRNVFDGDQFDVMSGKVVDRNLVHIGKKECVATF